MGLLSLVEDRPTPKAVYNWRVYTLAAVASFASCMIGYDSAFIGTTLALPSFMSEFGFESMSKSKQDLVSANIVSCYQAGAFFGAWAGYAGGYFLGRRIGLIIFAALFVLGSGVMLAADQSVGLGPIYGGRVVAGFAIGGASNLVPIYIAELAPPAVRGRLVGIYELGWQFGGLVGFWINYGISKHSHPSHSQWLIPFAVQLIPGGLLLIGCFWIKESPRWLLSKGRREEGLRNLRWIRHLTVEDVYIVEEVAAIDASIEAQVASLGVGFWKPLETLFRSRRTMWRFFLGSILFMWQNASGINAINYYSPTVFKSLGLTGTSSTFFSTGFYGVVKTVITFVWLLYLIDRFGRRNLLMYGALGGSICMWIIGAFVKLNPPSSRKKLGSESIAAIFFFYLWTACYTPSWNGTPWVINSEMFDMPTRPLGQASAAASNWFWNFIISRFTPQMFATLGYGVYFFFAALMLFAVAFTFFLIPETKGVPLEAMDRVFEIQPALKAHKVLMQELQHRDEQLRRRVSTEGLDVAAAVEKEKEKAQRVEHVEV